jgi:predicted transcriptional regulator
MLAHDRFAQTAVSMAPMIRTAYLRIYEPASTFSEDERRRWLTDPDDGEGGDHPRYQAWLVTGRLPTEKPGYNSSENAFVREVDGEFYICPWRTRLRMLAGLLAFRDSVPEEVAEAFVPQSEARRAAKELAALDERFPQIRSHILHANWHVPLRWFSAFDPSERVLVEDRRGLRIRYETRIAEALTRLAHVISVLEETWLDESVVAALKELSAWLEEFSSGALLELDYGSVAGMFDHDELVEDQCAAEVAACIEALEMGDGPRASRLFGDLTDKWATVRAHEIVN